jgi:proline dehydrogenase
VQVLRQTLLAVSRSDRVRDLVTSTPVSSAVVARYVPGETAQAALDATRELVDDGLRVSLDHLGEDTADRDQAEAAAAAYVELLGLLAEQGLTPAAEVSVKLSAVGQALPGTGAGSGERVALEHARSLCRTARNAGTTVTLDMEDHRTTDSTLRVLRELRQDFPETGAVVQSYLRRTEADCRDLAGEGSRVRLCKGAYREPASVAFQDRLEVDRSYVRCLKVLMEGDGYPMVATHDPRLVAIAAELAERVGRAPDSWEYQMLYGVRPDEQRRLRARGHVVRVYLPYGEEWYGYLMRRLAERPANLTFFLRSLVSRS